MRVMKEKKIKIVYYNASIGSHKPQISRRPLCITNMPIIVLTHLAQFHQEGKRKEKK